jgi:hypothetical protein
MAQEPQQNQIQIEIKPELATGVYSNLALITHSASELLLDFAALMPGLPKAQVVSRVVMHPVHAKQLMLALQDNIRKYEERFGQIPVQSPAQPKGNTIAPFGFKPGEA